MNAARLAAVAESPLGLLRSAFWIGLFSFREMIRRKRVVMVGIVLLLPVALTAVWRILDTEGMVSARLLLANLSGMVYVHFMIVVVSLAFGLSALGEPIDEGSIVYYWTRPLTRFSIYLGRLWAAQTVAAVLLVFSLAACFLVMVTGNLGIIDMAFLRIYLETCLVIVFGAVVYTAIFAALGTALRKPMLLAILYAFGWESISGNAPLRLQLMTVVFHLRNMIHNPAAGIDSMPNLLQELKKALLNEVPPPSWQSLAVLLAVIVISVVLGVWFLRRKELLR